ncbi:MAG TPA: ABA4-like family protein [Longimicrobium sp.]|nr:ABA4-like family protein [Longimicrobium sp.]
MYLTLYNLAGVAMLGWLMLILLPGWRVTRWAARVELFPVLLAVIYVVGIVPMIVRSPEMMRDFGSAEGVLRLLGISDVALIAWIHLLAFDQAVATMIFRDNQEHRYLPLPVQSVLLFLTLMFGPAGFLAYYALRAWIRWRRESASHPAAPAPVALA